MKLDGADTYDKAIEPTELRDYVVSLERKNAELIVKLGDAYGVRDDLQAKLAAEAALNAVIVDLSAMTTAIESERQEYRAQIADLHRQLAAVTAERDAFRAGAERLAEALRQVQDLLVDNDVAKSLIFVKVQAALAETEAK